MSTVRPTSPKRVASGLIVGGIAVGCAVMGGLWWAAFVLVFFPIAYHELMGLMQAKGIYPSRATVIPCCLLFYVLAYCGWQRHFDIVVTLGVILAFGWLLLRKTRATISDIGGTIMMFFYLGFLPAHFILLRQLDASPADLFNLAPGLIYLIWILFTVSALDVFAYYGGKRFGKKLLSPEISPKKTIEGAIIGSVGAIGVSASFAWVMGLGVLHGILLGALLAWVGQIGDLSESLIKRDAGLKDSGSLIPGHGGLLDRTDSYIFSGAVGYYYINWFILHRGLAHEVMTLLGQRL